MCSIYFNFYFILCYYETNIGLITLLSTTYRTAHSNVNQRYDWSLHCQPNIGLITPLSTKHRTDHSIVNQTWLITRLATKHRTDHSIVNQTGLITLLSTKHRTQENKITISNEIEHFLTAKHVHAAYFLHHMTYPLPIEEVHFHSNGLVSYLMLKWLLIELILWLLLCREKYIWNV